MVYSRPRYHVSFKNQLSTSQGFSLIVLSSDIIKIRDIGIVVTTLRNKKIISNKTKEETTSYRVMLLLLKKAKLHFFTQR